MTEMELLAHSLSWNKKMTRQAVKEALAFHGNDGMSLQQFKR